MRKPRFTLFWALLALSFGLIHRGPLVLPASAATATKLATDDPGFTLGKIINGTSFSATQAVGGSVITTQEDGANNQLAENWDSWQTFIEAADTSVSQIQVDVTGRRNPNVGTNENTVWIRFWDYSIPGWSSTWNQLGTSAWTITMTNYAVTITNSTEIQNYLGGTTGNLTFRMQFADQNYKEGTVGTDRLEWDKDYFAVTFTYTTPPTLTYPSGNWADGLDPNSGPPSTTFVYKVIYTDANNDPPAGGGPKVHIDGDATGITMGVDTGLPGGDPLKDGNYINGEQYTYSTTLTNGAHNYYFDASDGTATARLPASGALTGPTVNPYLTYSSEVGYGGADGVNPDSGPPSTTFVYRVVYTHSANTAPASGYPKVYIDGVTSTMTEVDPSDTNYTDGKLYTYSTTLALGTHNYYFDVSDGTGTARLPASGALTGPTVNTVPTLAYSSETGYGGADGVDPNSGLNTVTFVYKVVYTDADDQAPASGFPKVYIDGTAYTMARDTGAVDGTLRDNSYTNGEQYRYSTILAAGSHTYYFEATDGFATARLPASGTLSGPTVTTPTMYLSYPASPYNDGVDPDNNNDSVTGRPKTGVTFTYRIVYTHTNPPGTGTAPDADYPKVFLGFGDNFVGYTMTAVNPADTNYSDGKEYQFQTLLGPAPAQQYYFEARANSGVNTYTLPVNAPSTYNTGPTVRLLLGYNLVSLAKDLTAVSYNAADALGTSYAYRWVSTGLDITNPSPPPAYLTQGSFVAPTTISPTRTGEGYMMYANFNTPLMPLGGVGAVTAASFTIQLQPGWNMIGNPYTGNVLLQNTQVKQGAGGTPVSFGQAVTNLWIENALYEYNGNSYTYKTYNTAPLAVLTPWVGYWIYVKQNDTTYYLTITKP